MKVLVITALLSLFALLPAPAFAAPSCTYRLGFAAYHAANAAQVGPCRDDEAHDGAGDGWQHTVNGYLVWRKASNQVTFYADLSWLQRHDSGAAATEPRLHSGPIIVPPPVFHNCHVLHPDPSWPCTVD